MTALAYPQAEPANLSKAQVHSLAEKFAELVGYKPGGNLNDVIEKLGGKVVVEDTLLTDPSRSGSLLVDAAGDFKIILPAHTSAMRDRFTLAHELGHYVIHYLFTRKEGRLMALRRGSDRIEWEANWFAAAFLMSREAFSSAYARHGANVDALASEFGVSASAAEIRVKALGL